MSSTIKAVIYQAEAKSHHNPQYLTKVQKNWQWNQKKNSRKLFRISREKSSVTCSSSGISRRCLSMNSRGSDARDWSQGTSTTAPHRPQGGDASRRKTNISKFWYQASVLDNSQQIRTAIKKYPSPTSTRNLKVNSKCLLLKHFN